ncbi:MAG: hypothetical protein ACPG7F_03965 [Aggregatilineales bacterium]
MSKRKNRKKKSAPNIPQSTLERARRQVDGILDETPAEEAAPVAEKKAEPAKAPEKPASSPKVSEKRASRRRSGGTISEAQLDRSKKRGEVDGSLVAYMLQHPNKEVTNEDLKQDYGFVLRDLRNMGVLAALLMVLLVGLAQFI